HENIAQRARGATRSSEKRRQMELYIRSAMYTKKRIISAVKYSVRFQNPDAEGAGDIFSGGFVRSASLYKERMLSKDPKFIMPVTMNVFRTPIDVARNPPKKETIPALRTYTH